MDKPVYKRVLVKLSGEAMQAKDGIIDFDMLEKVADVLKQCTDEGVQVAVVVGAGNIWRGARQGKNMNRCLADHMGMPSLPTASASVPLSTVEMLLMRSIT